MGAWGIEAWESDSAADWFRGFFDGIDVDSQIAQTFMADDDDDNHEQIRAACYLLGALGRVYIWPGDLDRLGGLLDRGIELLTRMLEPDEDENGYLDEWDEEIRPAVRASIQQQIDQLKMQRSGVL